MAVTRDKARRLLSESEMALFGESRNPALRALTAANLARRIERTRKLRDKSRDLLQRQKLRTRSRTGSKAGTSGNANERTARKGEVLDDILQRFQSRLLELQRADAAETSGRPAARTTRKASKTARPRPAARRATTAVSKSQSRTPAARKAGGTTAARPAKKEAAAGGTRAAAGSRRKPGGKSTGSRTRSITPGQALANTRQLLETKQQRDRQPPAYRTLDAHAEPGQADAGFQSETAKARAQELHAGEARLEPIHGSISTRDRQSQGKRDHR